MYYQGRGYAGGYLNCVNLTKFQNVSAFHENGNYTRLKYVLRGNVDYAQHTQKEITSLND